VFQESKKTSGFFQNKKGEMGDSKNSGGCSQGINSKEMFRYIGNNIDI
jgi:hypothetical protein